MAVRMIPTRDPKILSLPRRVIFFIWGVTSTRIFCSRGVFHMTCALIGRVGSKYLKHDQVVPIMLLMPLLRWLYRPRPVSPLAPYRPSYYVYRLPPNLVPPRHRAPPCPCCQGPPSLPVMSRSVSFLGKFQIRLPGGQLPDPPL